MAIGEEKANKRESESITFESCQWLPDIATTYVCEVNLCHRDAIMYTK